jgi:hypothetical protein
MQSKAKTVKEYLAELPADRRAALEAVLEVFRKNVDKDYELGVGYGMIGYSVPHRVYPAGYHCDPKQPLPYAGMASQKNYLSLYMMCLYGHGGEDKWFREAWAKTGKKLDMGKICIRFKRVEDLALDVIAEAIRRTPARKYIEFYESAIKTPGRGRAEGRAAVKPAKRAGRKAAKKSAQARARK